jgi:class 3 adenylate cyclase
MPDVETVSILITDLVGSTDVASRIGPVAADELRQDHFARLRAAIEVCNGEEVKTTGDGLMVVFRAAVNAVGCAVSMQQGMERRNRAADEPLAIRIGVALGDTTFEEGDYFGMAVVEAVRLCSEARGGQILTTELVRIVGGRDGHDFRPVGALRLRGIPEPVAAFEVAWEPTGDEAEGDGVPLTPRLLNARTEGYVGRLDESERVRRSWKAACEAQRRAVLISGEPGIGKTRLATQTALEFHRDGAAVVLGHCAEEVGGPYAPWVEALSHLVEHLPQRTLASLVDRHGGELTRLAPALAGRVSAAPAPTQTDPETERYLLFSAVVGLLERATAVWPVVLVLDDLHWADVPTLMLLKHVIAETHRAQLLILGTYRDSDLTRDHPLTEVLADLRREEGIERMTLRGLDEDAIVAIMERAAGHGMDANGLALAREITAETDGNPFFVGEMLRHLSESGAVAQAPDGRWRLQQSLEELGLPQSLREVVYRRVDRLGENCRDVLTCAAVVGRDFDLELLARILGESEDRLIDLLEVAVEASVVQEQPGRAGSYVFAHNLINHTLYHGLGAARRSRLHRRVAEALEDLCGEDPGPRIGELARHWMAATAPVEPEKAVTYSRRAGERALAELAPDEAVRWFGQAIELLERSADHDPAERCELAIDLGEAQRQAGQPGYRETLLAAARLAAESNDADRAARAALANNRGFASSFGAVDHERLAALERAIELDHGSDPARCARLLALQAMELQFDPDHERRRALADRALALARESGDLRILPYVLRDHFHAIWSADTVQARQRIAEQMTELAHLVDDPLARIWALDRTVHAAVEAGALVRAGEASTLLLALTEELGQPGLRWHATYYAAGLAQMRGDLARADELAEAAFHLAQRDGEPDALVIYFGQIGVLRSEQGRPEEVVEVLEQAVAGNPGIPAFAAGLGAVLCDLGRLEEAAALLEGAREAGFAAVPKDQVCSTALTAWARVAADVGAQAAAAELYDLIEPWRGLFVWNGSTGYGAVEAYLGVLSATLGAHDRAHAHHAAASALHQREGVRGWEARNLFWWARSLRAAGATDRARATAEQALHVARENGCATTRRHAERLLEAAPSSESRR